MKKCDDHDDDLPVASLDHEDEPGERVLGYPPPVGHAQLLEHHEDDPGRVMLRDCARIEEERPEIGVNSRGLEKFAVFIYVLFRANDNTKDRIFCNVCDRKKGTCDRNCKDFFSAK